jgi:hypothetical protein
VAEDRTDIEEAVERGLLQRLGYGSAHEPP